MVKKVPRECPEFPLYIGIYNPTYGLFKDLNRVAQERNMDVPEVDLPILNTAKEFIPPIDFDQVMGKLNGISEEWNKHDTLTVVNTRNMMTSIAHAAMNINSDVLWLDLRHSEAGLIYCRAFEGMEKDIQKFLHKNMLSIALGPAEPISDEMAKDPINLYSEKDYITKGAAKRFMNNPDYNIRIIACISPLGELTLYFADHARDGSTYDKALDKSINDHQDQYKLKGKEK
jgi:hypothetical protein